jgi:hypothetical protein
MPGDTDGNGSTDVSALGTLATHFNRNPRGPRAGDFNGDGSVDVSDPGILASNFNRSLPAGNPTIVAARAVLRPRVVLFSASPVHRAKDLDTLLR